MKFNTISYTYTLFLYVMVMYFPSLIYAWTTDNPPIRPPIVMLKDCAHWINYNGFTFDNYKFNREKAYNRDRTLDKKASTWAAMYAFKIGGENDKYQMMPYDFCESFGPVNLVRKAFRALEDESRKCEDWIKLYRFSETDQLYNYTYAMNADPFLISNISIWAYTYWVFVYQFGEKFHLKPEEICSRMGKNVGKDGRLMPFMCENETLLYCKDWIYLFDFTDDPNYNFEKADFVNSFTLKYEIKIHYFPSKYAVELLELHNQGKPIHLTPKEFCKKYDGTGAQPRKYNMDYGVQNTSQ